MAGPVEHGNVHDKQGKSHDENPANPKFLGCAVTMLANGLITLDTVADHLKARFEALGIAVKSVGVKDIILPGDMKDLLGKVVEAEKAAQANVIRRREETNATRSLLNTAKVMETNAVALRLKELETLEKITDKIGNISVYGGLDSVLNDLVRMKQ